MPKDYRGRHRPFRATLICPHCTAELAFPANEDEINEYYSSVIPVGCPICDQAYMEPKDGFLPEKE